MSNHSPTSTPMPPLLPLPPLALIVATTPTLGIGLRGTLPWPPLKSDLAFFARVTKRAPPQATPHRTTTHTPYSRGSKNAVIMGRKTWDSIPVKFRPLKGRINVVVSRAPEKLEIPEEVMAVGGIEEGLRKLQAMYPVLEKRRLEGQERRNEEEQKEEEKLELGRVFVIGGAEIYAHALKLPCCERILWTRIKRDFECDTFFPGGTLLGGGEERGGGKWVVRSAEELREWTGEEAVGGVQREGEVEFEVCMVEREGEGVGEGIGG